MSSNMSKNNSFFVDNGTSTIDLNQQNYMTKPKFMGVLKNMFSGDAGNKIKSIKADNELLKSMTSNLNYQNNATSFEKK